MKNPITPLLLAGAIVAVPLAGQSPEGELKVRLTAPLTTKLNRTGDLVVAKIVEPAQFAGGYLEGEVREVHAGSAGKRSAIYFEFSALHNAGKDSRIRAGVVQIANSKHQADTDEDGAALEEEKGGGSFGGLSKLSSIRLGRSKGGEKQSSPATLIRLTAKAPHLSLATGSEMTVQLMPAASK